MVPYDLQDPITTAAGEVSKQCGEKCLVQKSLHTES